jgi:hypothetical protein
MMSIRGIHANEKMLCICMGCLLPNIFENDYNNTKKKQSICKYFAPIKKEFTHVTDAKQHYSASSADPVYASHIILGY